MRVHPQPNPRGYLHRCEEWNMDPLRAVRAHDELYLRWLQEVRRLKPSTVSRRMAVVTGFHRNCVMDS